MAKSVVGEKLVGPAGVAYECIVTLGPRDPLAWQAGIADWFLHCPGQSPAWDHYRMGIVHLRPVEGSLTPYLQFPTATHELLMGALDPRYKPRPEKMKRWKYLRPLNIVQQMQLPDDEAARELLKQCAQAVVDGILPAEPMFSGQQEPWRTTLIKTAAHARGEEHAQ